MQFLVMTSGEPNVNTPSAPPPPEWFEEMGKFLEETTKSGVLLSTGKLDPRATHVKNEGGKFTVTDGPFTEAKEVVVGIARFECKSQAEALEYAKRMWKIVGDGEFTIQQVMGASNG